MVVQKNPRRQEDRLSEALKDHTPENIEAVKEAMLQETCACTLFLNIECVHAPCTCMYCGYNRSCVHPPQTCTSMLR